MTFAHSAGTTPAQPLSAMAPPVMPAMSECDFEHGMPKIQQMTPHAMAPIMAATRAKSAAFVSPEKSTIPNIVFATAVEMNVMPTRPTKLNTAARAIAVFGLRQRVETTVAMAFGASVAPETAVTPMTRIKITNRMG